MMSFDPNFENWLEDQIVSSLQSGGGCLLPTPGRSGPWPACNHSGIQRTRSERSAGSRRLFFSRDLVGRAPLETFKTRQGSIFDIINTVEKITPANISLRGEATIGANSNISDITNDICGISKNNSIYNCYLDSFSEKFVTMESPRTPIFIPNWKHSAKGSKLSVSGKRKADPYQLVYNEDDSDSGPELHDYLSPKERVEQILRETELSDLGPLSSMTADSGVPEPDFSFDVQSLEEDEIFSVSDRRLYDGQSSSRSHARYTAHSLDAGKHNVETSGKRRISLPLTSLDGSMDAYPGYDQDPSPLSDKCHLDLDFTPVSNSDYQPENSFVEFSRTHNPNHAGGSDSGISNHSNSTDARKMDNKKRRGKSAGDAYPLISVRFHKCDLGNIEDESFIDDELVADQDQVISNSQDYSSNYGNADTREPSRYNGERTTGSRIYCPQRHNESKTIKGPAGSILPTHLPDMTLEDSEDAESEIRPEVAIGDCDTLPIVTVDQQDLTVKWHKKRRKLAIGLGTLAVLIAVGAYAAVAYLTVHILQTF